MVNQRLAVMPMEGNAIARSARGARTGANDELTIWVSTQMPHGFRNQAAAVFGLDADRVRVITPHVGGGFGGKAGLLAEHTVVIGAARALGRPVTWVETRSENLVSMPHGRAQVGYYELGLTREGAHHRLAGPGRGRRRRLRRVQRGADDGPDVPDEPRRYRIPKIGYDAAAALTNTTPVGAFRGPGVRRPRPTSSG